MQTQNRNDQIKPTAPGTAKIPGTTKAGRAFAPWTLVCEWRPECRIANPDTAEVYERWTYRSDDLKRDYEIALEVEVEHPMACWFKYNEKRDRAKDLRIYDNSKTGPAALQFWEVLSKKKKLEIIYSVRKKIDRRTDYLQGLI